MPTLAMHQLVALRALRIQLRKLLITGNALSLTVDSRVHRTAKDDDEMERNHSLTSVSAGRRSSDRVDIGTPARTETL